MDKDKQAILADKLGKLSVELQNLSAQLNQLSDSLYVLAKNHLPVVEKALEDTEEIVTGISMKEIKRRERLMMREMDEE